MITQPIWSVENAEERVKARLARLAKQEAATDNIFSTVFHDRLTQDLKALPSLPKTDLSGAIVSVKALLDVSGEVTHAGTRFLASGPAATQDAPVIAKLKAAGALMLGHTNMSELAYSGLGVNPHYGTADNPVFPGHIPGGSTSGGAASVAAGLADIAIGSDTGGSLRIPAAFCGLTGFKPSQASVSREGTVPLSDTLDSIGPMAKDVTSCAQAWQVMADISDEALLQQTPNSPAHFHVSRNVGFNDLDKAVEEGFDALVASLRDSELDLQEGTLSFLEDYNEIAPWQLTSVECRAHFEDAFQNQSEQFDPRVHSRMGRADELSATQYRQMFNRRSQFAEAMTQQLSERMLLLPTVAILPPKAADMADDAIFTAQNLLALRNTSIANIGDACSLAIPYQHNGITLSAMLISANGNDVSLLAAGRALERHVQTCGMNV
ncbi:amidase [Leucothrix sargassi]|nr:amidase [Leucothrix sargassi]